MIIVGLTGGIGHGKTTFASLLADQSRLPRHFESWELVAEVAAALRSENLTHPEANDIAAINHWLAPLPDIVQQCMHASITFTDIKLTQPRLQKHPEHYAKLLEYLQLIEQHPEFIAQEITTENKEHFRPLLQWLGGFLVVIAGNLWYDEIIRRVALLQLSGTDLVTIGGVRYPADAESLRNAGGVIIQIDRPTLPSQDAHDITERDRRLITPDCIVLNNGTLSELSTCAQHVYKDLQMRQLTSVYEAQKSSTSSPHDAAIN